jgi:membrane protease YdiL (CAAX protease family)
MIWLGPVSERPFGYYFFLENLRALSIIFLVLLVLWLKNDQWKEVGLVKPDWIGDAFLAWVLLLLILLWVPIEAFLRLLGISSFEEAPTPFLKSSGLMGYSWIFLSALLTAFAEELLIRGYLISRLMRLFGMWKSVLVSSIIFSIWHFSHGIIGLLYSFLFGIIFGIAFTKTRSLCPLVIAHTVSNAMADFLVTT